MCIIIGMLFGALAGWIIPPFASLWKTELYSFAIFSVLPSGQIIILTLLFSWRFPSNWQSVHKRFVCFFISFLFFSYGYPIYTFVEKPPYDFKEHLILSFIVFLAFFYSLIFVATLDEIAILVTLLCLGSSCVAAYLGSKGIEDFRKRRALAFSIILMSLVLALSIVGILGLAV